MVNVTLARNALQNNFPNAHNNHVTLGSSQLEDFSFFYKKIEEEENLVKEIAPESHKLNNHIMKRRRETSEKQAQHQRLSEHITAPPFEN